MPMLDSLRLPGVVSDTLDYVPIISRVPVNYAYLLVMLRIIIILPDSIRNYLSGFVDDQWMNDNGFLD